MHTGREEHRIGDLAQHIQIFLVVDVTLALPAHIQQQLVGPRESRHVLLEGLHVGVGHRDHLEEARIQLNLGE